MKINKKSSGKKKKVIALSGIIVVLLLLVAGGAYALLQYSTDNSNSEPKDTTSEQLKTDDTKSQQGADNEEKAESKSEEKAPITDFEPDASQNTPATMIIDEFKQVDGVVSVVGSVDNESKLDRCYAYFTSKLGDTVSKNMSLTPTGSKSATCSVDVDEREFSYLGEWKVRVIHINTDNVKVEAVETLTIR